MKSKKMLSMLLTLTMAVTSLPMSVLAASYPDTADHWANAEIAKWSDYGIIQGSDGMFRPAAPITRGEMAVVLDNVMNYQEEASNTFADLDTSWYTSPILKANAAGVLSGDGTTVRPKDKITREESAVMFARALGLSESSSSSAKFTDSSSISSWAVGYVNAMADKNFVSGVGGNNFAPKANITRGEVVKILDNVVKGFYSEAKEYTGTVSGNAVVNISGATLKDMKISGDLIISEGVADGDVTLDNVTVSGKTIVRGGGENSIHVNGTSVLGDVVISKNATKTVALKVADTAKVGTVTVEKGSLSVNGTVATVNVTGDDTSITTAKDSKVELLSVTGSNVKLSILGTVAKLELSEDSDDSTLEVASGATVTLLVTDAKIAVDNKGTITKAEINANDVTINGTKPGNTVYGSDVTTKATGDAKEDTKTSTGGGGGGGSSSSDDDSSSNRKLKSVSIDNMKPMVGDVLTAITSPSNASGVTYEWKSGDFVFSTEKTYTVEEINVGTLISVTAKDNKGNTATATISEAVVSDSRITSSVSDRTYTKKVTIEAAPGATIDLNNVVFNGGVEIVDAPARARAATTQAAVNFTGNTVLKQTLTVNSSVTVTTSITTTVSTVSVTKDNVSLDLSGKVTDINVGQNITVNKITVAENAAPVVGGSGSVTDIEVKASSTTSIVGVTITTVTVTTVHATGTGNVGEISIGGNNSTLVTVSTETTIATVTVADTAAPTVTVNGKVDTVTSTSTSSAPTNIGGNGIVNNVESTGNNGIVVGDDIKNDEGQKPEVDVITLALDSIAVTKPSIVDYTSGDALDLSGMVVKATYTKIHSNGSAPETVVKDVLTYTTTPAKDTKLSPANTSVEVSFTDAGITKTASFTITVAPLDKTALSVAIASAKALTEADYTTESFKKVTDALDLPETTQEEINAKTTAINKAIAELIAIVEKPVITITTQPVATTTTTEGSIAVTLTVAASATESASVTYQWYSNSTAATTGGTAITGATTASYAIPTNLEAGTDYYYYCVVSAANADNVTSSVAKVTVNPAEPTEEKVVKDITITRQPTKTTFTTADTFDYDGLTVKLNYTDDTSSEEIEYSKFTERGLSVNITNSTTTNASLEITITHSSSTEANHITATFSIVVEEQATTPPETASIPHDTRRVSYMGNSEKLRSNTYVSSVSKLQHHVL